MNLSFHIAKKYFFSGKKRGFIHFISIISMLGVCVGTAALIIVLSVFNGLEDLNRTIFKSSDPDIKVTPASGKTFPLDSLNLDNMRQISGISVITEVIEDNALARREDQQIIVDVKGVDSTFQINNPLENNKFDGELVISEGDESFAFVGGGVYQTLNLQSFNYLRPLQLWYPRNQKLNALNPEDNINRLYLPVSGAFILEQQYDNLVYIPLKEMEKLTELYNQRTSLEIRLSDETKTKEIKTKLKEILGASYLVKDRDEQNEALYRAIKIEKLFIFLALLFIIGIASFNIYFALSMLVLDKKDDIQTLSALGAEKSLVRQIFVAEGGIISLTGALLGLIIGVGVCWSQMQYGWLSMGMQFAIVDAYPVLLKASDVILSLIGIVTIAFLASWFPASKAVKFMNNQ
ncbi:ABC transporter permease [Jiulongibacter sediminis]|uniref:Releasing system transmembrane protein n=1 Tax=Jiulongibacter sediminis TaxID=1605367 RepID=A0A0P7BP67_9BACT|nr:FtsX-like permease family protein [Jiulongibacter sediminis]KPM47064.1 releasing system transmembrane protein [Jiulongibacter sediminis]TBX22408.1 releasing system transmembrane protein [Jiulongibacter sediminis]